jgi:hypothetical protein
MLEYNVTVDEKIAIIRTTHHDRSAMLRLSLEFQQEAELSDTFKTFIFVDPHPIYGYDKEYNDVINNTYFRFNWPRHLGRYSWYDSVKYMFENTSYDYILSIEDDIVVSKDYFRLCKRVAEVDKILNMDNDILNLHIGAWEQPKGNPNKIVRSQSSSRSILINRFKFYKYVDTFYRYQKKENIQGLDLDVQTILNINNLTTIAPEMNRHGHFGIYGWSASKNKTETKNMNHQELYEKLKKNCLDGKALQNLNHNYVNHYFWDFNPNISFDNIEYSI